MANKEYIERLQMVIHQLHGCDSKHLRTVPVKEVFRGQTAWEGFVEVFSVNHPKAKHCFGWSHLDGDADEKEQFVTVLELPPVDSPETAVKVAIAAAAKKGK